MRFEESKDRGEHRRIAEARAEIFGRQAGQREQPIGPLPVADDPAKRAKRMRDCAIFATGIPLPHPVIPFQHQRQARVGQKILVVEDNELNLKLFCDLLRAHAYTAEPVRDGREAVARARELRPDLIVMDIQMPHISGLSIIEELKADAELKAIPIMAVTAYAAKGDEERIRDAGAEGYVSKPISVQRFVQAVEALLGPAPRP
jgi:two-component system cell cycle response regulator DivK